MFLFQLHSVCHFGNFINFGLGTVRSERAKNSIILKGALLESVVVFLLNLLHTILLSLQ